MMTIALAQTVGYQYSSKVWAQHGYIIIYHQNNRIGWNREV